MRKTLALAAVAVAALTAVPVQSASAQCIVVPGVTGCVNPCLIVARAVPQLELNCTL